VTTTGVPTPSLAESGALPAGLNFKDNGDGTATLSGSPSSATGSPFSLNLTATNGISPDAQQTFTLTVTPQVQALAITSANSTTFVVGTFGSFKVTTTGLPVPLLAATGTLPAGVNFSDNGDGTATLSGTPSSAVGSPFSITLIASNGVSPNAQQTFTLTVNAITSAPAITSGNSVTFTVGALGSFKVTATGAPTPSLTEAGALPDGVTFTDNGDGTATLTGTPSSAAGSPFSINLTASNGVSPSAHQSFTLTLRVPPQAPTFVTSGGAYFTTGSPGEFTVAATGVPTPSLTETGLLPSGLNFINNGDGTGILIGVPDPGSAGTYFITFNAGNGQSPDAVQNFLLIVY